ncbi:holin [uncultured Clostridium sp.]|uniref:holin n=1 Tax=uncultured Clostridium sp. TaxID=59620 RepID=UPI002638FD3C|nr:holin [uncultured Clostridium sp.]
MNKNSFDFGRLKNYGLWVSVAALAPMILEGFGVSILPDNYQLIVTGILGILVTAGILSNPTTSNKGFLDDNKNNDSVNK